MPKTKTKSQPPRWPSALILLAGSAIALFAIGEAWNLSRNDRGRLFLSRRLGIGDPAHVTKAVGRSIRSALLEAGVPRDSIHESVPAGDAMPVRWRVGLRPDGSPIQLHHAISSAVQEIGAEVLRGREAWNDKALTTTLLVGLPKRPTHEIALKRWPRDEEGQQVPESGRIALVLYGFGDGAEQADSFFAIPAPFAVALLPGTKSSAAMFRAAHRREREVVLHLPLEPVNYPRVDPGPGTLLVTMKPTRVASEVRRHLAQAEPVAAVANHMGSLATQDMTLMRAIYGELRKSHVPFLHVNPAAGAVCRSLAADMGVPYGEPDAVIERETHGGDPAALDRRWKALLREARKRGSLTVWVRATPLTKRWLPKALQPRQLDPVSLVPLSALVRTAAGEG